MFGFLVILYVNKLHAQTNIFSKIDNNLFNIYENIWWLINLLLRNVVKWWDTL